MKEMRTFFIFLFWLGITIIPFGNSLFAQENSKKHVLILKSYHQGFQWDDNLVEGMKAVLKPTDSIDLHIESMDTKRIHTPEHLQNLLNLYKYKFEAIEFDLIITSDDNAFNFLREYRDLLFPTAPAVFVGVNNFKAEDIEGLDWITGIADVFDGSQTINAALKLHPDKKMIYVINDYTPTGIAIKQSIIESLNEWKPPVQIVFSEDASIHELLIDIEQLPDDSLIYLGAFFRDQTGRYFGSEEIARLIVKHSPGPVYTTIEQFFSSGVVGGNLLEGYAEGKKTALIGKRILGGISPSRIPVVIPDSVRPVYDYNALTRWKVDTELLPPNAIIRNRSHSFYERYKELVWQVTALVVVLSTIILALIANIQKRKKAEKNLQKADAELGASNQQLGASNQQLRSSEQQLKATEQQLKASNQELEASNQQLRASNQQLMVAEHLFSEFFNFGNIGSVITSVEKGFVRVNKKFLDMFGYTEEELKQKTWPELTHPDDLEADVNLFNELLTGKRDNYDLEKRFLKKDGSTLYTHITVSAARHPDGSVKNVLATALDITVRRELEAEQNELRSRLSRAERMESLVVLAGGVAHDLNNSLGPLVALPQLILEDIQGLDMEPNETIKEIEDSLSVIEGSALRSAEVVKDLLSLSRRGQYALKPFDLNTAMCIQAKCECPKNIRLADQNVKFTSSLASEPLMIMADKSHLERAIGNLVHNAAESISENGSVDIRSLEIQIDEPIVGYEIVPPDRYAVLEVTDTGKGISKEDIDHIFEPFLSKKEKTDQSGSGLGLAVVHGIVKDHGGFIDVESNLHKGTTFTLYLPMISEPAETSGEDSEEAASSHCSERILVVDDEKSQRFTLTIGLKRLGYDVSATTNGREAVALFAEAEKEKKESPFDIVLLDMTMEHDFDGLDTYQAILELYPTQKVIISSGHAEVGRIKTALDLGADCLRKPYRRDDLAKALRRLLDKG